MNFRASFCNPFNPKIIELGKIDQHKVMETFENIPWKEYLAKMKTTALNEIHYSPSLEVENMDNKNGLSLSIISNIEWYIFYKRPKLVKTFFGLSEKVKSNYLTEIHAQTEKDVKDCLAALIKNNLQFLEDKIR
ncbi:hypothetical protein [Hymenobacter psoromatis]|uniref:hypothetical protein n=1 Tax=Hymenobacter psoromatis TaxID=1484116 RepID=UPI001CC18332|nr:hypothetical protein [Hymenobacter psoromatis]